MKKTFVVLAAFLAAGMLYAQEGDSGGTDTVRLDDGASHQQLYTLQVGAQIGIVGGGITLEDPPEGRKVNPAFWFVPTYGAVIYAPFGIDSKLGGRLDIGVSTTATKLRPYEFYNGETNWNGEFVEKHTYFTIAPSVSLAGVLIGVGFNFPMMVQRYNPDFEDADPHTVDPDLLNGMDMDLRIGGMIAAWKTDIGTLNVELLARMFLSGIYKEGQFFYGYPARPNGTLEPNPSASDIGNLIPASVHIGISYLINIGL